MSKPISYNDVSNICIRVMDFFAPEDSNIQENEFYEKRYFEEQDELRIIIEAWLRQNNIPFEEK